MPPFSLDNCSVLKPTLGFLLCHTNLEIIHSLNCLVGICTGKDWKRNSYGKMIIFIVSIRLCILSVGKSPLIKASAKRPICKRTPQSRAAAAWSVWGRVCWRGDGWRVGWRGDSRPVMIGFSLRRAHRQLIRLFARGIEETPVFDDIIPPI